jgi:pimeloyl-ACP methyl ester carboxylesterase
MAGLAAALSGHAYVVTPTHPGFDGTPRVPWLDSAADLADAYLDLIEELGLDAVMVIGNSLGGWIAAEMALRDIHGKVANQQTLAVYAGKDFMFAPKLRRRLHRVTVPVLVAWGEEDRVVSPDHGRSYAAAFGNGQFTAIAEAGHLPQIEQPGAVLAAIGDFAATVVGPDRD